MMQSHYQVGQKWAILHLAANQIVSEIYHFLGNVGRYAHYTSYNNKRFVRRLQDIVKNLTLSNIHEDELQSADDEDDFPEDALALEQHVMESLYGIRPRSWLSRKLQGCFASAASCVGSCGWESLLSGSNEVRDFVAPVSAELYMELRVLPLKKCFVEWARRLWFFRLFMTIQLVLCLALGSCFGAFGGGLSLWIPVVLAVATFTGTILQWFAPNQMVVAVNLAQTMLKDFELRWQGSDIAASSGNKSTKYTLIRMTERLCCDVATTFSGAAGLPEELDDDMSEEASESPSKFSSRDGRRSAGHSLGSSRNISTAVTPYGRSGTSTPY